MSGVTSIQTTMLYVNAVVVAKFLNGDVGSPLRIQSECNREVDIQIGCELHAAIYSMPGAKDDPLFDGDSIGGIVRSFIKGEYPGIYEICFEPNSIVLVGNRDEYNYFPEYDPFADDTDATNESKSALDSGEVFIDGVKCVVVEQDVESGEPNFYADIETGEFVQYIFPNDYRIKDDASYDWAMRKRGRLESEVAAVDSDPDVIWAKTILKNAEAIKKRASKKLENFKSFVDPKIEEYGLAQVKAAEKPNGKGPKSYTRVTGSVGFTTVNPRLTVRDEEAAIKWAEEYAPEAVKVTKSFLISKLEDGDTVDIDSVFNEKPVDKVEDETQDEDYKALVKAAFIIEPGFKRCAIKSGVAK